MAARPAAGEPLGCETATWGPDRSPAQHSARNIGPRMATTQLEQHKGSTASRPSPTTSTTPPCSAATITTTEPTSPATSPSSCQRRLPLHETNVTRRTAGDVTLAQDRDRLSVPSKCWKDATREDAGSGRGVRAACEWKDNCGQAVERTPVPAADRSSTGGSTTLHRHGCVASPLRSSKSSATARRRWPRRGLRPGGATLDIRTRSGRRRRLRRAFDACATPSSAPRVWAISSESTRVLHLTPTR